MPIKLSLSMLKEMLVPDYYYDFKDNKKKSCGCNCGIKKTKPTPKDCYIQVDVDEKTKLICPDKKTLNKPMP